VRNVTALLIPADLDQPMRPVRFDDDDWAGCRQLLDCQLIEPVTVADDVDLFVDQEAVWRDVPLNNRATALWTLHAQRGGLGPTAIRSGRTTLWGNVLVVGPASKGHTADAPAWVLALAGADETAAVAR
jgi:hypothetical protein